jgi:hypothetical protein
MAQTFLTVGKGIVALWRDPWKDCEPRKETPPLTSFVVSPPRKEKLDVSTQCAVQPEKPLS